MSKAPRALFFTFSRHYGGDDTVLLELLKHWPERAAVVLNADHPARPHYEKAADVVAFHPSKGPRPWAFLSDAWRLAQLLRRESPRAVLASSGGYPLAPLTWRFLWAAKAAYVPRIVLAVHNYPNAPTLYRKLAGNIASLLCDQLVTVSRDCAKALERFNLRRERPVRVVLNGLSENAATAPRSDLGVNGGPLVGALGNLEDRKGFLSLAEAMRLIPKANCVIVGDDTGDGSVVKLSAVAQEKNLKGRLILAGYKPDAARYASCFDVCAVPSLRNESFGMAALEAMRAGKPVVATRVGGLPEVVEDGVTGLLVEPGEPKALAEALSSLLNDPAKAKKFGEAGRKRWRELFTSERMAREYRELL